MTTSESAEITRLLRAWAGGDQAALEQLTPKVYVQLHQMAHRHMRNQQPGHTLQSTALVHELFLRLVNLKNTGWKNRVHFFAISATAMRQILVDWARGRQAIKRGGQWQRANHSTEIDFDRMPDFGSHRGPELIALDDALTALAELDPRKARVVELRFFGGLSVEETAAFLNLSPQSIMRDWKLAKVWLLREMGGLSSSR